MFKATAGGYALWFLIVLAFGKIAATSLTMGIGGSGGTATMPPRRCGSARRPRCRVRRRADWAGAPATADAPGRVVQAVAELRFAVSNDHRDTLHATAIPAASVFVQVILEQPVRSPTPIDRTCD
jgi:hypothetical protein